MFKQTKTGLAARAAIAVTFAVSLVGCGGSLYIHESAYSVGYDDGFADDSEYYGGYIDSWITEGPAPIYYSGHEIPYLNDDSYDAGYYDGLFDAYNDGYFVAYRYAFIIGFSEGYDAAYFFDYLNFLFLDNHLEYLHGGFSDGYNDGFSEGRVFGAFDYEVALPFDWLDAFLDWEAGTDLYFEEVDVGTGVYGPVTLYEWGLNPFDLFSRGAREVSANFISMRSTDGAEKTADQAFSDLERPLTPELEEDLNVTPTTTDRSDRDLTLDTSWLERIDAYDATSASKAAAPKNTSSIRATSPRAR